MRFDDSLWKGILEDLFADFLRFFFADADQIFDLKRGFVYLDKEMAQIAVDGDPESPKYVDKLVKVFTREGNEQWVLVHVEVQGYVDNRFEERMYRYYYRIFDRYRQRITAVVLLTDRDKKFHPKEYRSEFLGTAIHYCFNSYKIIAQEEEALVTSGNPFAFVILTVLLALQRNRLTDKALFDLKIALVRRLLEQKFSKAVIKGLFYFIRNYVVFADRENRGKFDEEIDSITQKGKHMGIVEMIKEREAQEILQKGLDEGKKQGMIEGKAEGKIEGKAEIVSNLLAANQFTEIEIANFAGVSRNFVRQVGSGLKKKK